MAFHELKDFAGLCGKNKSFVQVYIGRKQVVQRPDGLIDDQDPVNQAFLLKWEKKKVDSGEEEPTGNDRPALEAPRGRLMDPEFVAKQKEKTDLELKIQRAELEHKLLRNKRITGQVVPVDKVVVLLTQHNKSIATAYKNATEDMITEFAKKKSMSPEDIAYLRFELVNKINAALVQANEMTKTTLDNDRQEFANKRDRGEKL